MTRRGMLGVGLLVVVALVAGYRPHIRMEGAPAHPTPHALAPARHSHRPSPPESGNSIVTAALAVVARHTVMPLRGPEGLPGHPLGARLWLAAAVTATPTRYAVDLLWAPKLPPPIESPAAFFAQVANPHAVVPDGSFGGTRYPSAAAARAALASTVARTERDSAPFLTVPTTAGTSDRLTSPGGPIARVWHLAHPTHELLLWPQKGWRMELAGQVNGAEAQRVARRFVAQALPARYGLFADVETHHGATIVLAWVQGRAVYWVRADRLRRALLMATRMVSYRTVSATLINPQIPVPSVRRELRQLALSNRQEPWIVLTEPQLGASVGPGQLLPVSGRVLVHSPFIQYAETGKNVIAVSLNGGAGLQLVSMGLSVPSNGLIRGTIRIPYSLPALNGSGLLLTLQFVSHNAPVTEILLRPRTVARH